MKNLFVVATLSVINFPVFAQSLPAATLDQRVAIQIGNCALQNTKLLMQNEQTAAELVQANSRIKVLEDKYEPKPDEKK